MLKREAQMSMAQFRAFENILGNDFRPLQDLNGRTVSATAGKGKTPTVRCSGLEGELVVRATWWKPLSPALSVVEHLPTKEVLNGGDTGNKKPPIWWLTSTCGRPWSHRVSVR